MVNYSLVSRSVNANLLEINLAKARIKAVKEGKRHHLLYLVNASFTILPHGLMRSGVQLPFASALGRIMEQVSSLSEIDQLTQLTLFFSMTSSHF